MQIITDLFILRESARRLRAEKTTGIGGFVDATNVQDALEDLEQRIQAVIGGLLRVVTVAGTVTVSANESGVAIKKMVPELTNVQLPPASSRGGLPVEVKDADLVASIYAITVLPDAGDTLKIDTMDEDIINSNGGARRYIPVQSGSAWGWIIG